MNRRALFGLAIILGERPDPFFLNFLRITLFESIHLLLPKLLYFLILSTSYFLEGALS